MFGTVTASELTVGTAYDVYRWDTVAEASDTARRSTNLNVLREGGRAGGGSGVDDEVVMTRGVVCVGGAPSGVAGATYPCLPTTDRGEAIFAADFLLTCSPY